MDFRRGTDILGYGYNSGGIALNYDGTIAVIGDYTWSSFHGRAAVFQRRDDKLSHHDFSYKKKSC